MASGIARGRVRTTTTATESYSSKCSTCLQRTHLTLDIYVKVN